MATDTFHYEVVVGELTITFYYHDTAEWKSLPGIISITRKGKNVHLKDCKFMNIKRRIMNWRINEDERLRYLGGQCNSEGTYWGPDGNRFRPEIDLDAIMFFEEEGDFFENGYALICIQGVHAVINRDDDMRDPSFHIIGICNDTCKKGFHQSKITIENDSRLARELQNG